MIVTVTTNAALDRTLTVPVFQIGFRHRSSEVLTLAGGKGINVARALKILDVPVVATGLAGGRTGTRIIEELTSEAILNDFVRISAESRTSTAVVDPTAGTHTEINEWGPEVGAVELETLVEKLHYLSRGADFVVLSGSLPRKVATTFYADAVRDLERRDVRVVLDSEGEPLRLAVEAGPFLVSPNQREAEQLVGQELEDDDDFLMALDAIAEMGARNVLITLENGCFALMRVGRKTRRIRAFAPHVEPVSGVGSGDVLLAQFLAASATSARRTTRSAPPSQLGRHPCARSAPDASIRRTRRRSPLASSSQSCTRFARRLRAWRHAPAAGARTRTTRASAARAEPRSRRLSRRVSSARSSPSSSATSSARRRSASRPTPRRCARGCAATSRIFASSSSATAARWRSSSATRSWPSSASRSRTRTMHCVLFAPRRRCRRAIAEHGLEARIGVNTGEVVVGGESETLVTGDAVNVAARLEQAAP